MGRKWDSDIKDERELRKKNGNRNREEAQRLRRESTQEAQSSLKILQLNFKDKQAAVDQGCWGLKDLRTKTCSKGQWLGHIPKLKANANSLSSWNETLTSRLATLPENLPANTCYKAKVAKAGLVGDFEKLNALKVPVSEDKYSTLVDDKERDVKSCVEFWSLLAARFE